MTGRRWRSWSRWSGQPWTRRPDRLRYSSPHPLTRASTPAVRLTGVGRLEHIEMPVGEPSEGEVLLRVLAVGLCGSDAHWFREGAIGDAALGDGLVLGHEFSAVIETGPRAGQRVAVDPAIPCLTC